MNDKMEAEPKTVLAKYYQTFVFGKLLQYCFHIYLLVTPNSLDNPRQKNKCWSSYFVQILNIIGI